ncbi:MAG TPA: hypothetical protein VF898_04005, partial [Chloroflexota bacterium]
MRLSTKARLLGHMRDPVAGLVACVIAFVLVAALAFNFSQFQRLDTHTLVWLTSYRGSILGSAALGIAHLGDPIAQAAILVAVCLISLRRGTSNLYSGVVLVAGANVTT